MNDTIPDVPTLPNIYENSVPSPYGTTYPVQLFGGLNNILVPRGAFLSSPLGQAVLGNATAQYTSNASLPVAGVTMSSLACYWQNLAVSSTPYLCGGSGGTAPGTPNAVKDIADQQSSLCSGSGATNCAAGGVPSNPLLEPSNVSAPALQAVLASRLPPCHRHPRDVWALLLARCNPTYDGMTGFIAELRELHLASCQDRLGQAERAIYQFLSDLGRSRTSAPGPDRASMVSGSPTSATRSELTPG